MKRRRAGLSLEHLEDRHVPGNALSILSMVVPFETKDSSLAFFKPANSRKVQTIATAPGNLAKHELLIIDNSADHELTGAAKKAINQTETIPVNGLTLSELSNTLSLKTFNCSDQADI